MLRQNRHPDRRRIRLDGALDSEGASNERTLRLAAINATFQTGFHNPIDEAIAAAAGKLSADASRLDEIPYDFTRKRLSVLAQVDGQAMLISKGALSQVLEACTTVELANGQLAPMADQEQAIRERYAAFSARGPFWRSRPSTALTLSTLAVVAMAVAIPYTPLGRVLGFAPLPPLFLGPMGAIVLAYVGCAEWLKRSFYRKHRMRGGKVR